MAARHGLFIADGTTGVTAPQDGRLAMAGMLSFGTGDGPLDATAGVFYGPGDPCKVTGTTDTPNMKYSVAAGYLATARGTSADGLQVWCNDAAVTVDSATPAPSSGSRYDLIYALAPDSNDGFADADSDPILDVQVGTAASTPTKPTADLPDGALVLAEALVASTDASGSDATITQVAAWKAMRGAPVPVRDDTERDALTGYAGLQVYRIDLEAQQTYDGTAWIGGDDTDEVTSGVVATSTNATVVSQSFLRRGGVVYWNVTFTSKVSKNAGDVANAVLTTITDDRFMPASTYAANTSTVGNIICGFVDSSGEIEIQATAFNLAVGDPLSLGGSYPAA